MYLLGSRNHFHVSAWFKVTQFLHSVSFLDAVLCTTEPLRTIISVPPCGCTPPPFDLFGLDAQTYHMLFRSAVGDAFSEHTS